MINKLKKEMENLPEKEDANINDEPNEKIADDIFAEKIKTLKEKVQSIETTLLNIRGKQIG